jgi:hypothetical protein
MAGWIGAADQPAVLSQGTISMLGLGWLLASLAQKGSTRVWSYLAVGALTGATFGGAISALTYQAAIANGVPFPFSELAATLVNGLVSPAGCAFVVCLGHFVGKNLKVLNQMAGK